MGREPIKSESEGTDSDKPLLPAELTRTALGPARHSALQVHAMAVSRSLCSWVGLLVVCQCRPVRAARPGASFPRKRNAERSGTINIARAQKRSLKISWCKH